MFLISPGRSCPWHWRWRRRLRMSYSSRNAQERGLDRVGGHGIRAPARGISFPRHRIRPYHYGKYRRLRVSPRTGPVGEVPSPLRGYLARQEYTHYWLVDMSRVRRLSVDSSSLPFPRSVEAIDWLDSPS